MVFEWLKAQLNQTSEGDTRGQSLDQDMLHKSFSQLGGDSLAAIHLTSLLREHLSLDVPVDVVLKTPLASILTDVTSEKRPPVIASYDWAQEASLDSLELSACQESPPLSQGTEFASSVLLTGCTGFLGRFILWQLLQDKQIARIFCLTQNKDGREDIFIKYAMCNAVFLQQKHVPKTV